MAEKSLKVIKEACARMLAEAKLNKPERSEAERKNCLSYWHPKVAELSLPSPRTEIVRLANPKGMTGYKIDAPLLKWAFGEPLDSEEEAAHAQLMTDLRDAVGRIGTPCFLRSGQTSAKHSWKATCFLESAARIEEHVYGIVEYSECASLCGLPVDVWAVREMLRPRTYFDAFHGGMPISLEVRMFVGPEGMRCAHPYWPAEAFEKTQAKPDGWEAELRRMHDDIHPADVEMLGARSTDLVRALGDDAWSVDWLFDVDRGWVLTDMALAPCSYHWPGCEVAG